MSSHNNVGKESTMDKIKDVLHLNKDKDHSTTHSTPASGIGSNTHGSTVHSGTGTGSSGITGNHNTSSALSGSTNHGSHDSNVANKLDPTIDSDRDGRAAHGNGLVGSGGLSGNNQHGISSSGPNTTAGPHSSNLVNRADPRVDSDLDGSRQVGGGSTGYGTHSTGLGSSGVGHQTTTGHSGLGTSGVGHTGTTGHSSGLGSTTHSGVGSTGTHGGISNSTNAGPHESAALNKADPRVDSDLDGRGNRHIASGGGIMGASGSHATPGSGTAQNTAGPHGSDMANKLDPRVDSNLDGSKTYGGNATHR